MRSPCNTTVRLADGSAVRVSLKGRVRLSLIDERRDIIVLELRDVLYVPSLSRPLFSVPAFLGHRGNSVTFLHDRITFCINYTLFASIPKNNFDHVHALATSTTTTVNPTTNSNYSMYSINSNTLALPTLSTNFNINQVTCEDGSNILSPHSNVNTDNVLRPRPSICTRQLLSHPRGGTPPEPAVAPMPGGNTPWA